MTFELKTFLLAVGLLWIPLPLYLGTGRAYKTARFTRTTISGLFCAWQSYVDLLRAAAGTFLLLNMSITATSKDPQVLSQILYIKAAILAGGILVHSVRIGNSITIFAPVFFLTGIICVLPGYTEGGFAALFAWLFSIGTRQPRFVLPAMALSLAVASYFLSGINTYVLLSVALLLIPVGFGLLLNKRLMFVSREKKGFGMGTEEETATKAPQAIKA